MRYPWGPLGAEEALPVSVFPLGEWGLWDLWVPFGGVLSPSVGRLCSPLGKERGVCVTPWFSLGSGGLYTSPLGVEGALQDTWVPFGCRSALWDPWVPSWVRDGSASTWLPFGGAGVCWGLDSLWGCGGESPWDPWVPFVGGCSARCFDPLQGGSSRAWVGGVRWGLTPFGGGWALPDPCISPTPGHTRPWGA